MSWWWGCGVWWTSSRFGIVHTYLIQSSTTAPAAEGGGQAMADGIIADQ